MDFCVIMTVWNFNKLIEFVVERALSLFDHLIALDTGSTDGSLDTLKRLERAGRIELYSYVKERGAGRDGNFLLEKAGAHRPRWIVKLDHDEYFEDSLHDELPKIRDLPDSTGWVRSPRVTLWRDTGKYRVDGKYRWFIEDVMFRWREGLSYPDYAVHHMKRVPEALAGEKKYRTRARLVHLSQVDEERVRLQVERLREFDRDWSKGLFPDSVRLRTFRERSRRKP